MGWKMATLAAVLGVIALTVWAAVAAGLVKGPGGVLVGAVLTALAAWRPGMSPESAMLCCAVGLSWRGWRGGGGGRRGAAPGR